MLEVYLLVLNSFTSLGEDQFKDSVLLPQHGNRTGEVYQVA